MAVAWIRHQAGVMIPLLGARTLDQLRDNLGALDVSLAEEHRKRLHDATAIDLGFPHEFLTRDHIRNIVYGGTYDLIDNHRRK